MSVRPVLVQIYPLHIKASSRKSEDNLALSESEMDKNATLIAELTRKNDELQVKADEATRLKDQVDE